MQQKWVISIIWLYDFQFTLRTEKVREGHTENYSPGRNRNHQQQEVVLTGVNLHPKVIISLWLQFCCGSSYSENRGWWTPSCKILVKNMNKIIYFTSVGTVSMYLHGKEAQFMILMPVQVQKSTYLLANAHDSFVRLNDSFVVFIYHR